MIGQASLVGRMHSLVIWKGVLDISEVGFRAGYDEIWTLDEQIKILWNFSVVCANSPLDHVIHKVGLLQRKYLTIKFDGNE
jgi:hypothetical protein